MAVMTWRCTVTGWGDELGGAYTLPAPARRWVNQANQHRIAQHRAPAHGTASTAIGAPKAASAAASRTAISSVGFYGRAASDLEAVELKGHSADAVVGIRGPRCHRGTSLRYRRDRDQLRWPRAQV